MTTSNTYVPTATVDMSRGMVEDIAEQSRRSVVVAQEEERKVATSAKDSGAQTQLYGDLAVEALVPGAKAMTSILGFLDARRTDKLEDQSFDSPHAKKGNAARHVEDDIKTASGKVGVFRAEPAGSEAYDGMAANTRRVPLKVIESTKADLGDVFSKASIAGMSLKEQGKDALKSWDVPEQKIPAVAEAKKELTFGVRMANEAALNGAKRVQEQQAGMTYKAAQLMPSMMASGPTIRPQELLREAEQISDSGRIS